ncbi:MAG: ATP-binding protein, partial [Nitrospirales bacterium]
MNFKVAARVISHLGAELISSDEIAIYELVKNGFDAGSEVVEVNICYKISTKFIRELQALVKNKIGHDQKTKIPSILLDDLDKKIHTLGSTCDFYCELTDEQITTYVKSIHTAKNYRELITAIGRINYIEIVDQGEGMTIDEVERYYFTVGTTHRKQQVLDLIKLGDNARPPTGEKGIGRLSAMRLGHNLEMLTISENSPDETYVSVNWNDFEHLNESEVSDIPIDVHTRKRSATKAGTYICISDLSSDWSKPKIESLATKHLAKFIDPFNPKSCPLTISLKWNGLPIKTRELIRKYLDSCQNSLVCHVEMIDGHAELESYFVFGEVQANPRKEFTRTYTIADFNGLTDAMFAEVGPFDIEMYHFPRNKLKAIPLFASRVEVRKWLDEWCGGLMIFRDGIRVMPYGAEGDDWLDMDAKALRGRGFRVNRLQTVGCVRISRTANPGLIDQTNREGLRETPEFTYFHNIIRRHIQESFVSQLAQHMSKEKGDLDHLLEQVTGEYDALQECVDRLD